MALRYTELVRKVRDWANRDAETLPDSIVGDSLEYAADITYRTLKVPALESVATYTIPDGNTEEGLVVPEDLTEFISLRLTNMSGQSGGRAADNRSIVYNQKADYRTFRDIRADQYDFQRWARREHEILIHPVPNGGEIFELFYYRRLPALDARYQVNVANQTAGLLTEIPDRDSLPTGVADSDVGTLYRDADGVYFAADDPDNPRTAVRFYGAESPNWLRDEQEKILIWGSLVHIFNYLGEDQMAAKYLQLFQQEIELLNVEEGKRKLSGANVQQNFDGFLI